MCVSIFFCRHYILYNPVQEQSLDPFAAHVRRGVIMKESIGMLILRVVGLANLLLCQICAAQHG